MERRSIDLFWRAGIRRISSLRESHIAQQSLLAREAESVSALWKKAACRGRAVNSYSLNEDVCARNSPAASGRAR